MRSRIPADKSGVSDPLQVESQQAYAVVSETVTALQRALESEKHYKDLFEHASDIIYRTDTEGRFTLFNPTAMRILQYAPEEILGRRYVELIRADMRPIAERHYGRQFVRKIANTYFEFAAVAKDGREVWLGQNVQLLMNNGQIAGFQAVARDITDRKQVELDLDRARRELEQRVAERTSELQVREAMYRRAIAAADGVVYQLDFRENTYTHIDESIERLIGYTVAETEPGLWHKIAVIHSWRGMLAGLTRDEAVRRYRSGEMETWTADYVCRTKNGQTRWIADSSILVRNEQGEVTGCLGILQDITERRQLEDQLLQAQKMDSVGRLAGGVAHDFNNYLTAILGYTELAQSKLAAGDPVLSDIQAVSRAGERAADLVSQLLAFARKQMIAPTVIDLNQIVLESDELIRRLLLENVELETRLLPGLWPVRADRSQIEQVLLNLVVNARDAISDAGAVSIETGNITLDRGPETALYELEPGEYASIAVSDTGAGMNQEIQSRLFEPFFTTKELGKGTGLGLATCYGIVKQSGGHIVVSSAPGRGATFRVYLPRAYHPVDAPRSTERSTSPIGAETILIVEDEPMVRRINVQALRDLGYTVLESGNGVEALDKARSHTDKIDLLVSDVVMPRMGGGELAHRLQAQRPGIRVLFISGYTDSASVRESVITAGAGFLQKPYKPDALARQVRRILDEPPRSE